MHKTVRIIVVLVGLAAAANAQEAASKYPPLAPEAHKELLQISAARWEARANWEQSKTKVQEAQNALDKAQADETRLRDIFARLQFAFNEWIQKHQPNENCTTLDAQGNWGCPEPEKKPEPVTNGQ